MRDIILVVPVEYGLTGIRDVLADQLPVIEFPDGSGFAVSFADGEQVQFVSDESLRQYYDVDEGLEKRLASDVSMRFLVVRFKEIELAKELLGKVANRPDIYVDNDHGLILPGDEFIRRCEIDKDWDWARVSS